MPLESGLVAVDAGSGVPAPVALLQDAWGATAHDLLGAFNNEALHRSLGGDDGGQCMCLLCRQVLSSVREPRQAAGSNQGADP